MFGRIHAYFAGARQEFRSIKWPTVAETRKLTLIVIVVSIAMAIFLGFFDFLFTYILTEVII